MYTCRTDTWKKSYTEQLEVLGPSGLQHLVRIGALRAFWRCPLCLQQSGHESHALNPFHKQRWSNLTKVPETIENVYIKIFWSIWQNRTLVVDVCGCFEQWYSFNTFFCSCAIRCGMIGGFHRRRVRGRDGREILYCISSPFTRPHKPRNLFRKNQKLVF